MYLRTPNFTGKDVEELQTALGALGFACGGVSGTFGAYTEGAWRNSSLTWVLSSDGIAGVNVLCVILKNLHNAWMDKPQVEDHAYMGFARAADVLEHHAVCLFGTEDFTRKVASNMSNLAMATNPRSKMVSAETLLVLPDEHMILTHIVRSNDETDKAVPRVVCDDASALSRRIAAAVDVARDKALSGVPLRIAIEVPGPSSAEADQVETDRLAHHDAIMLLDAFCMAFS